MLRIVEQLCMIIGECRRRFRKGDTVLVKVGVGLLPVPFEVHNSTLPNTTLQTHPKQLLSLNCEPVATHRDLFVFGER